jgi:hypothetical protein
MREDLNQLNLSRRSAEVLSFRRSGRAALHADFQQKSDSTCPSGCRMRESLVGPRLPSFGCFFQFNPIANEEAEDRIAATPLLPQKDIRGERQKKNL